MLHAWRVSRLLLYHMFPPRVQAAAVLRATIASRCVAHPSAEKLTPPGPVKAAAAAPLSRAFRLFACNCSKLLPGQMSGSLYLAPTRSEDKLVEDGGRGSKWLQEACFQAHKCREEGFPAGRSRTAMMKFLFGPRQTSTLPHSSYIICGCKSVWLTWLGSG